MIKNVVPIVTELLSKIAVRDHIMDLFSNRMIFNAAFLVDRNKVQDFSEEISKLTETFDSLKIKYTGPWPPFNFVTIKIGVRGVDVVGKKV